MIYDYENGTSRFETPAEEADYKRHMAEFGPGNGKAHPDSCPYCAQRGWDTHPEKSKPGKAYSEHMAEFGPATRKSHPNDCEYCAEKTNK